MCGPISGLSLLSIGLLPPLSQCYLSVVLPEGLISHPANWGSSLHCLLFSMKTLIYCYLNL